MKKVLITLVVGAALMCANAATYSWSTSWSASLIYGPDGTTSSLTDVTAYLYCDALGSSALDSATVSVKGSFGGVISGASTVLTVDYNTEYSFYLKLIANYNGTQYELTTKDTAKVCTEKSPTLQDVEDGGVFAADLSFGNMKELTSATGNWTAANVPEPTSGLLLLLGMAGLALRRKRA